MTNEEKTADEKKWAERAELAGAIERGLHQAYDATLKLLQVSDPIGSYENVLNNRACLHDLAKQLNESIPSFFYAVREAKERGTPGYHDRREAEMRHAQAEMSKESMLAQCAAPVPAGLIQGGGLRGR